MKKRTGIPVRFLILLKFCNEDSKRLNLLIMQLFRLMIGAISILVAPVAVLASNYRFITTFLVTSPTKLFSISPSYVQLTTPCNLVGFSSVGTNRLLFVATAPGVRLCVGQWTQLLEALFLELVIQKRCRKYLPNCSMRMKAFAVNILLLLTPFHSFKSIS